MFVLKSKPLKTELYRKIVHLSSLWMPWLILTQERNKCMLLFGFLFLIDVLLEYAAYSKVSSIGILFRKMFIKTLRNKEISRTLFVPSGSVYILAAALIVSVCYSAKAAAAAMCIVLIADSNAALIGRFLGTIRFYNGKSLEGTAAFFISTAAVILAFFPNISLFLLAFTAGSAAAIEFFEQEIGIDDNLAVPVVSGFILNLMTF